MKSIKVEDILSLSIPERIQLVEEIWDTIAYQSENLEITQEEKQIIDERLEARRRNPKSCSSWEEVYQRITANKNDL